MGKKRRTQKLKRRRISSLKELKKRELKTRWR